MEFIDILMNCPLFKGLSAEEIEMMMKGKYQIHSYKKGDIIAMRDEECNALNIVLSGSVKGEMLDMSGRVIKIEDIEAPKPLAVAFIFGQQSKFPVDIVSNGDVKILRIQKLTILEILQSNQQFLTNFLNTISNRTQFLSRKLFFLSFKTIKQKLAYYLSEQYNLWGEQFTLNASQQQLAELFGVARPSLARAMGELVDEGILIVNRKAINIINKDALFAFMKE
ncbi:MAG: Crp/Fnr family transcriptional regulator [Bacteroidales bacterium]|nr:Crp/Fnr family transcriptional regulator [Bacteroidales bacterium]